MQMTTPANRPFNDGRHGWRDRISRQLRKLVLTARHRSELPAYPPTAAAGALSVHQPKMPADSSIPAPSSGDGGGAIPVRSADDWHVERSDDHLSLQFTTNTHQLRAVRLAIESFCRDAGFNEKCWSEIGLVVNEAVANITRHAYDTDQPMPIDLNAQMNAAEVTITLRDWGNGQVPPAKMLTGRQQELQTVEPIPEPGGLGLICMKQLMKDVTFIPQHPGMLLRMSRPRQC